MKGARVRSWLPAVLWSAVLLIGSTPLFGAQTTGAGLEALLTWTLGHAPAVATLEIGQVIVRKLAHFVGYGIEGALTLRATRAGRTDGELRSIAMALAWTLVVASLDEFNQSFSPLRTGTPADVLLDMMGASTAILILRRRPPERSLQSPS